MTLLGDRLNDNQRKAEMSFAYLSALCAHLGYTCQRGPSPDEDSIDATVRALGSNRPLFDVQLKATSSPVWHLDGLHFRLKRKNYDDLRVERSAKLILVVLELPPDLHLWVECEVEHLVMRRSAWWDWLFAEREIKAESKVIVIPESQRFDLNAIPMLMERIRNDQPLKE